MKCKHSILVSNILDPYTKTNKDMIDMYIKLAKEKRYTSIETRLIKDEETRITFNQIVNSTDWNVVLWLTGDMGRANINLSSLDNKSREVSIKETMALIDMAATQCCNQIGIASGRIEDKKRQSQHIQNFIASIKEIINYIEIKKYKMDIIIEPLDEFAHKKNVIGTLASTKQFLKGLEDHKWLKQGKLSLCFDSAHIALNNDDFKTTLKELAPFISRVHFADAIIDKENIEYGDNHRSFDEYGIMNIALAKDIIQILSDFKTENDAIFVACEVRTKEKKDVWVNEDKYYSFLCTVIGERE